MQSAKHSLSNRRRNWDEQNVISTKLRLECQSQAQRECFTFFISRGAAPDKVLQEAKLRHKEVQMLLRLLVGEIKRDENLLRMFIRATFEPGLEENLSYVPDPTGKFVRTIYDRFKLVVESEVNPIEHFKKDIVWSNFETFMENFLPIYTFRLFSDISSKGLVDKILLEKFKFAVLNNIRTPIQIPIETSVSPVQEQKSFLSRAWDCTKMISRKMIRPFTQAEIDDAKEPKKRGRKLNASEASEYLVVAALDDDDMIHKDLGRISDYLKLDSKENRERIYNLLNTYTDEIKKQRTTIASMKEYKKLCEKKNFLRSIKEDQEHKMEEKFKKIRELGKAVKGSESYHKYESTVKFLMMPLIAFLMETQRDENVQNFRSEWKKLNKGNSVNFKFPGLQKVGTIFDQQLYDIMVFKLVESLLRSEMFMKDFRDKILHNGLALKSCRYFLAKVFDINLRVYVPIEKESFKLFENLNESAEKILSLSIKDANEQRTYQRLVVNEDFLKLDEIWTSNNNRHHAILADIESFSIENLKRYISEEGYAEHIKPKVNSDSNQSDTNVKKKIDKNSDSCFYIEELKGAWDEFMENNKLKNDLPNPLVIRSTPKATGKYEPGNLQINDEFLIKMICKCFPKLRRPDMENRLHLVSCTVTGSSQILHAILNRLHVDGVKITTGELFVVLNIISNCFNTKRVRFFDTFCWILMSCPQQEWLLEFSLFQFEFYLQKSMTGSGCDARLSLQKVAAKEILILFVQKLLLDDEKITEEDLREALKSLKFISIHSLDEISKLSLRSWKHVSTKEFFAEQVKLLTEVSEENQKKICFYLTQMQNVFGTETIAHFLKTIVDKRLNIENDVIIRIVRQFYNNEWILSEDVISLLNASKFSNWESLLREKFLCKTDERTVEDLIQIIRNSPNISTDLMDRLESYERSINEIYQSKIMKFGEDELKDWNRKTMRSEKFSEVAESLSIPMLGKNDPKSLENSRKLDEKIAAVTRAIMLSTETCIKLRPTQLLALVVLLKHGSNILVQIMTGEGKSLIAVAFSIIKAFKGEQVDIITSSKVLAERDATNFEFKKVFQLFNFTVGHNCNENESERKIAYSSCNVIYGDLANFQRDFLLDTFYNRNILGGRRLENVLIDEVDSMLLDKGNNILYLSQMMSSFDDLRSLYIFIWRFLNQSVQSIEDLEYILNKKCVRNAVLSQIYGMISKADMKIFFDNLNDHEVNKIWYELIEYNVISDEGIFNSLQMSENVREKLATKIDSKYVDYIEYVQKLHVLKPEQVSIPEHLRGFVMRHLDRWLESALRAMVMQNEKEYIVDVDRSGVSPDRHPVVIIQDTDTGSDQWNSQWDEALHQFLQLKHGCKITDQSLKAVFISNVTYFKQYRQVYGMSGTLGLANERDKLSLIHHTDFFGIPNFKPRKFEELEAQLFGGQIEWIEAICEEAIVIAKKSPKKRSVLIICESVQDLKTVKVGMKDFDESNIVVYDRSFNAPEIRNLQTGKIFFATNIAGRGTDITLAKDLEEAGGLHVILTFLPNNVRVEQQAFGRAARCGAYGTGRLIIKCKEQQNVQLIELKHQRDKNESMRIEQVCEFYSSSIQLEEKLFKTFKESFKKINNQGGDKVEKEVKEILSSSFLQDWAFWLDENNDAINKKEKDSKLKSELEISLQKIEKKHRELERYLQNRSIWQSEKEILRDLSPSILVNISKYFETTNKFDLQAYAVQCSLEQDRKYLATNYFNCFAISKELSSLKNFQQHPILLDTILRFEESQNLDQLNFVLIDMTHKKTLNSLKKSTPLKEQYDTLQRLNGIFVNSIKDIQGQDIFPNTFAEKFFLNDIVSGRVFDDLMSCGFITKIAICNESILKPSQNKIVREYGIRNDQLQKFLSKNENMNFENLDQVNIKLKEEIDLPSCEDFWEVLKRTNILENELTIVTIDQDRMEYFDPSLLKYLRGKTSNIKEEIESLSNKVFLYFESEKPQEESEKKEDDLATADEDKWEKKEKGKSEMKFSESQLKSLIFEGNFKKLESHQIFSFNKVASIDSVAKAELITDLTFEKFSTLQIADFKMSEIPAKCIEPIVELLLEQKALEKSNDAYSPNIDFDFDFLELKEFSAYTSQVRLFNRFFIYPMALRSLRDKVMQKEENIFIAITSQTHMKLLNDLIATHFITPSKIDESVHDKLEKKLDELYSCDDRDNFIGKLPTILEQSTGMKLNCDSALIEKLKSLKIIKLPWLESISNLDISEVFECTIKAFDSSKVSLGSGYEAVEDSIKQTLLDHRTLSTKRLAIAKGLQSMISPIVTKECADVKLLSLDEYTKDIAHSAEVATFKQKGLDSLMTVEEKKWTAKVINRFTSVVFFGLLQIALGCLITVLSLGFMTHVGSGLVGEGIGDCIFAISAIRKGHFTWGEYFSHKWVSALLTVSVCGVGALLSRIKMAVGLGSKVAGPALTTGIENVAELSGIALLEAMPGEVARESFQAGVGAIVRVATLATIEYKIDKIIHSQINKLGDIIAGMINQNVYKTVRGSKLSETFEQLVQVRGKSMAGKIITQTINSQFQNEGETVFKRILDAFVRFEESIAPKLNEVLKNNSNYLSIAVRLVQYLRATASVNELLGCVASSIESINRQLSEEKDNSKKKAKKEVVSEKEMAEFKFEMTRHLEVAIDKHTVPIINEKLIRPLLRMMAHKLSAKFEERATKFIKTTLQNKKEADIRKNVVETIKSLNECEKVATSTEDQKNEKSIHQKNLVKSMSNTLDPKTFALIGRQDVPMNMVMVEASVGVIQATIAKAGIGADVNVTIKSEKFECKYGNPDPSSMEICINLNNNHFGDGINADNDCYYNELCKQIPEMSSISANDFRNRICNVIESDPYMNEVVGAGYHKFSLSQQMFGGCADVATTMPSTFVHNSFPHSGNYSSGPVFKPAPGLLAQPKQLKRSSTPKRNLTSKPKVSPQIIKSDIPTHHYQNVPEPAETFNVRFTPCFEYRHSPSMYERQRTRTRTHSETRNSSHIMNVTHLDDMTQLQNIINVGRKLKAKSKLSDPIAIAQPDGNIRKRIKSVFTSPKVILEPKVVARPKVIFHPKSKTEVMPPWTKTKKIVVLASFALLFACVSYELTFHDTIISKKVKTSVTSDMKVDVATEFHENLELSDVKTSTKTKEKEKEKKKFGKCEINIRSDIGSPQPLLTHPGTSDFYYPSSDGIIHLGAEKEIEVHCMKGFTNCVTATSITLKCLKGKQFLIDDSEHNFKSFICNVENTASELNTRRDFWSGAYTTEINFSLDDGRKLNLMTISRNSTRIETNQVRFNIPNAIGAKQSGKSSRPPFLVGSLDIDHKYINDLYKLKTITETFASILGSTRLAGSYIKSSYYGLSKGHITASADFVYNPQQAATFAYINTAPQWQSINVGNWLSLEKQIRNLAANSPNGIDVISGTYGVLSLPDINGTLQEIYLDHINKRISVPLYFYRIIGRIAYVTVNNPYIDPIKFEQYHLCNDVFDTMAEISLPDRFISITGYTYACTEQDFLRVIASSLI